MPGEFVPPSNVRERETPGGGQDGSSVSHSRRFFQAKRGSVRPVSNLTKRRAAESEVNFSSHARLRKLCAGCPTKPPTWSFFPLISSAPSARTDRNRHSPVARLSRATVAAFG